MENKSFIEGLSDDVLSRHIEFDGDNYTLDTFLTVNMLEKDVDHISTVDAREVVALEVGQSHFIGTSEVKRVE